MTLRIWGASTLNGFTDSIASGFRQEGVAVLNEGFTDLALIQIHGSPAARYEDEKIIEATQFLNIPKAYLIHRPDEALMCPFICDHFERHPTAKLIFLGDLIFRYPFWETRRAFSVVIPHPHLDLSLPSTANRPIVGAFTSWGEMRSVKHYFALVEYLVDRNLFEFRIGGTGLNKANIPKPIQYAMEPFVPHFNVQLYHLLGKKRYGESSGSLHRGVSIPIIFEANGAERLEGFRAIKIEADEDLKSIQFDRAANEISKIATEGIDRILESNLKVAKKNSVRHFAKIAMAFLMS